MQQARCIAIPIGGHRFAFGLATLFVAAVPLTRASQPIIPLARSSPVSPAVGSAQEQGVTYRIRSTTRLPGADFGTPGTGGPAIIARGTATGGWARIDFQSIEPPQPSMSLDQYLLLNGAGVAVTVDPVARTYSDGTRLPGLTGVAGMLPQTGGDAMVKGKQAPPLPPTGVPNRGAAPRDSMAMPGTGMLAGFQVRDVRIDVHTLGGGEVIEERRTNHYLLTCEYSVMLGQQLQPIRMTIEIWSADVPPGIINPFDPLGTGSYNPSSAVVELAAKLNAVRRQITGTPIKYVTTISLADLMGSQPASKTIPMPTGAAAPSVVQTVQITSITAASIDLAVIRIPVGFTKR